MTLCKCMSADCYDCFHEYGADALKPPPQPGTTELDTLRAEVARLRAALDHIGLLNADPYLDAVTALDRAARIAVAALQPQTRGEG